VTSVTGKLRAGVGGAGPRRQFWVLTICSAARKSSGRLIDFPRVSDTKPTGDAKEAPAPAPRTARVAAVWDEIAAGRSVDHRQGWLDHSLVFAECFQARVSGDPRVHWLEGLMTRACVPKGGRWASLGCGAAGQEIAAGRQGLFSTLAGFDASTASLDLARRAADEAGLTGVRFATIDLDRFTLPAAAFDVVVMNMALHHVREIRPALETIRASLLPGGVLLLNEFVGPRQFQFPETQLEVVRTLLAALPERYRMDSVTKQPKNEYVRMPVEHWNVADPSEAIRSDLILSEVSRLFEIVVRADYGGTVLNLLLEHIVHNFDADDERDAALVRLLSAAEALLIDSGVLTSDFTAVAARPRPAPDESAPRAAAPPPRVRSLPLDRPPDPRAAILAAQLAEIHGSRGWRLLQGVRSLFGRRW